MRANMKLWTTRAVLAGGMVIGGAAVALAAAPNAAEQAEIAAVQTASVTPTAAIKAAEAHAGGRALGFGYERSATTNAYEVTVATSSGLKLVQVDPANGTVLGSRAQPTNAMAADGLPAGALQQAAAAPTPLASAVSAAEQSAGGRALEANYVLRHGQMSVDVDVAKGGAIQSVSVDPANGHVSQAASAENEAQEGHGAKGQAEAGEGAQDAD